VEAERGHAGEDPGEGRLRSLEDTVQRISDSLERSKIAGVLYSIFRWSAISLENWFGSSKSTLRQDLDIRSNGQGDAIER
jgi:hypothetical protein